MDNQFSLFPVSFTFLVFILMVFKIWMKYPKKQPPGPWKLPIIGHLHLFIFSLPHQCLRDLAKKHGPIMHLQLGQLSHIIVSSPEVAKEVMKTHDINFANRPFFLMLEYMTYNFTDILFAPYGGYWRQLRKICTLELLSAKRVQSFRTVMEEEVSNLIALISSNKGLMPINIGEMLSNLTYDIVLKTVFSGRCKHHETFLSIVKKVVEEGAGLLRCVFDLLPSLKLLYGISGLRKRHQRLHQEIDEIIETIVEKHRANKAKPKNGDDVTDHLVDVLLKLQESQDLEFPFTIDNIKAVLLDLLVGGTETSSITMVWAMAEMVKNPRVMEKAQAEVRQVFGQTGEVTESNIHKLKYLNLVIKETLRLHPPVPLIPRETTERCEIKGYEIPAKTKVFVNVWAIGRDPNYWNEAEVFDPERFLDSSIDYKGVNFEYIPFGAGRRICPGISFVMAAVELCLANLLYHFDWKLPNGMKHEDLDMTESFSASAGRKTDLCLIPIPYDAPCVGK